MPGYERAVADLAAAVLDGTPADWAAAEAGATEQERRLLEELRLLCTIADVHRQLPPPAGQRPETIESGHLQYWGRLRLIERVGGGTSGDVYRAWDPRLHREVALKLIPVSDHRSDSIIREGRLLARVRHSCVVTIYDAEQIDGQVGLCMEFVEGPTLEGRLQQKGVFTAAETIEIGLQLCDALSAAHGAGVLHRDVKASNVVVNDIGRIVLMDFGAGRQLDDAFTTELTGTPLYLAPEVLQGQEATVRSDVYSLGVLLYRLVTGSYPVQARSLSELHLAHTRRMTAQPGGGIAPHPGIPARLAGVLACAIDPHPERRYDSAAALARDLRALQRGRGAHGWSIALSAVALVVVAAAAGLHLVTRGSDRPDLAGDGVTAGIAASAREPVRLAVLPFAVEGSGPDSEEFREGMVRDLIARLQVYDSARVISTESVFSAATLNLPIPEIGTRLGVSAILTGTLLRSGDTVTIGVELLRVSDGHVMWQSDYTRPVAEVLEAQRAIALDVAGVLGLQRQGAVPGWPTRDVSAYALYVRGMTALDRFTPDGTRVALRLFEQALELDPEYAQAHAAIAMVYLQMERAIPNLSEEEVFRRASEAAARAMSLDDSLPEAYAAAAAIKSVRADWSGAERDYQRAIELGPSNVLARQQYAHWLSLHGRADEAVEQARVAESLDPLSPRAAIAVASALRFGRRYEEGIVQAHKALDLDPAFLTAYLNLGHHYQGLGRLDEAIDAFQRMGRLSGNLGHVYALTGRTGDARALIAHFEQQYAKTGLDAGHIAQIYSGLGEIDRAFEWLDRQNHGWPTTLKVAPVWDPLRADPRFTALLRKYGLAD